MWGEILSHTLLISPVKKDADPNAMDTDHPVSLSSADTAATADAGGILAKLSSDIVMSDIIPLETSSTTTPATSFTTIPTTILQKQPSLSTEAVITTTTSAPSPLKRPFKILADLDTNTFKLVLDNSHQAIQQQPLPTPRAQPPTPARTTSSPNKQPSTLTTASSSSSSLASASAAAPQPALSGQHGSSSVLDDSTSPIYGPPQIDENARIRSGDSQFTPDERVVPVSKYMMERTVANLSMRWDRYGRPRVIPSWAAVKEVEEFAVPTDTKNDPSLAATSKLDRLAF